MPFLCVTESISIWFAGAAVVAVDVFRITEVMRPHIVRAVGDWTIF